jgi:hypothetical protein
MKTKTSLLILFAILLVSCAPASMPVPIITATDTPLPTATLTPEPTATFTPEPTATPEFFDVQVLAFWDYNGNGIFDEGEPPLEGVVSQIGSFECSTEVDGTCTIAIPAGRYTAKFVTTNAEDSKGVIVSYLEYLFLGTDILKPRRGFPVEITDNTEINAALAQGPYPVPANNIGFADGIYKGFGVKWETDTEAHGAIDLRVLGEDKPDTPPVTIYANVTGYIEKLPDSTPEQPFGPCGLVIITPDSTQNVPQAQFYTGHLTGVYVSPNQRVIRGQPIGEIDSKLYAGGKRVACTYPPHLEYTLWANKWLDPLLYSTIKGKLVFGSYGQ